MKCFQFAPIICLITLLVSGCSNENAGNGSKISINGNVGKSLGTKVYLNSYGDSMDIFMGNKVALDSSEIDEKGNFAFNIDADGPLVFSLQCGNKDLIVNQLLCKGDHLDLDFIGELNVPKIVSKGEPADFNNYMLRFVETFYKVKDTKQDYYVNSNYLDVQQYAKYTSDRKKEMLDFYDKYFGDKSIRKEYRDYAIYTINYEFACDRLMYLWKNRMKGHPAAPDSTYFDFIEPGFIENKDAFITPSYIRFLNLYVKDVYERMVERGELPVDKTKSLVPVVEKYRIASGMLHGQFLNAVKYNLISNDLVDLPGTHQKEQTAKLPLDSLEQLFKVKYNL